MKKFFDKLIINIFNKFYKFQQSISEKKLKKLKKTLLSGKIGNESFHTSVGATLSIKNKNDEKYKIIQSNIEKITDECIKDNKKFFEFIKKANTPIYKIKYANKILKNINEEEGFILPKKGIKALYLNLILNKSFNFNTREMFVVSSYNVNPYAFLYQFYNWYCFKMKLNGFETETQENFKHVFEICETSKIDSLSYEEILNMKTAIKRDVEAINFVKKMTMKYSMSKKNLDKIKLGEKVNV